MGVDGAAAAAVVVGERDLDELLPREDAARVAHEGAQDRELGRREGDRLAPDEHLSRRLVDDHAGRPRSVGRRPAAPCLPRRSTALTRATSSLGENGFVT